MRDGSSEEGKNTPTQPLEQILWETADKMRGNPEAGEYTHFR